MIKFSKFWKRNLTGVRFKIRVSDLHDIISTDLRMTFDDLIFEYLGHLFEKTVRLTKPIRV